MSLKTKGDSVAIEFLECLRSGPWVLTAIIPDGRTFTETFSDPEEAREFINEQNKHGRNIYYSLSLTKRAMRKKARKEDIAAVEYLHVDVDPREDETSDQFIERITPIINQFPIEPSLIVESGNGLQLLWRLKTPYEVVAVAQAEAEIETLNHALAVALGADPSTRNIDRILRVPGTTNYPNAKKRKLGRKECEAVWVRTDYEDRAYNLEDFANLEAAAPDDGAATSKNKDEFWPGQKDDSRSGYLFGFFRDCKRRGLTFEEALQEVYDGKGRGGSDQYARERKETHLRAEWDRIASPESRETTHSWEDPDVSLLDDRRGDLPGFPIETLSGWLPELVQDAAAGAGVTVDHVAVPLLGVAAGLIGTARRIEASRSWSEPATCWTGIVGFSGTGKSPGLGVTKKPLDHVEDDYQAQGNDLRREHELRVEQAKAAKAAWKAAVDKARDKGCPLPPKPAEADDPEPFITPRIYVSDTTIEKMTVLLQARPRGMLLIADELAGWFHNMTRYSGGQDNQFWLMAWDGNSYKVERLGRPPVNLKHLLVGIVGGLQPDKLTDCFKGAADGMYARFIWSWPAKAPYRPLEDWVDEVDRDLIRVLDRLASLPQREFPRGRIPLSDPALAAFEPLRKRVYDEMDALDGREREWWAKVPTHVLRLALTLTYLSWAQRDESKPEPQVVSGRYIEAAGKLVLEYFWPHAQACLRQIGLSQRHADARQVLRWIKAKGLSEIRREEVRRGALSRVDADQAEAVLEHLARAGWLRRQTTPTKGRPTVRWEVNPLLLHPQREEEA